MDKIMLLQYKYVSILMDNQECFHMQSTHISIGRLLFVT